MIAECEGCGALIYFEDPPVSTVNGALEETFAIIEHYGACRSILRPVHEEPQTRLI